MHYESCFLYDRKNKVWLTHKIRCFNSHNRSFLNLDFKKHQTCCTHNNFLSSCQTENAPKYIIIHPVNALNPTIVLKHESAPKYIIIHHVNALNPTILLKHESTPNTIHYSKSTKEMS